MLFRNHEHSLTTEVFLGSLGQGNWSSLNTSLPSLLVMDLLSNIGDVFLEPKDISREEPGVQ